MPMPQIIINSSSLDSQNQASTLQSVNCGPFFNAFVESQKKGYETPDGKVKKKGISSLGASNLRTETAEIMSHCNPHNAVSRPETTHLVFGYVQSGKTMSFTALTALVMCKK